METIRNYVEQLVTMCGVTGSGVSILTHLLLIIVAIFLAWLVGWACQRIFIPLILKLTSKTSVQWDDILISKKVLTAVSQIIPAFVIWAVLPLTFDELPTVMMVLERLTAVYITVMFARAAIAFVDAFKELGRDKNSSAQQYLITVCGVLKIIMIFIAGIVVIAILIGKSPVTLLAGLGATSAILMLVFQDTITGLVAGVRLTSNDMLHRGDWITVEKAGVNGIVEDMSLTTVKVRNFDNTILTISPKTLVNESFQNWKGMQSSGSRRVLKRVYFDFLYVGMVDDALRRQLVEKKFFKEEEIPANAVNVTLFRQYIQRWLANHPAVNHDMWMLVMQAQATQNGMGIDFLFYLNEISYIPFENQSSEMMEYIYAVAPQFGMKIYQQREVFTKGEKG